jgi:hypothetical protein
LSGELREPSVPWPFAASPQETPRFAKEMREELNHDGTTGTTEEKEKMKSLESPINADERR